MPKPKSPQEWLAGHKAELMRRNAAIDAIDRSKSKLTSGRERLKSNGPDCMSVTARD